MIKNPAIYDVLKEIERIFESKNKEYKGNTADTFRNFTQGGRLQSETAEQTLLGYANKQIVSLYDAKHHNPERLLDYAFVKEKALDIAIYMILLTAMTKENSVVKGPMINYERVNEVEIGS